MQLRLLLLSSDEKTVRILRRVLSDLEIVVDHCSQADIAIRKITRERFEAIVVDCANPDEAGSVMRSTKAAPVNKRALSVVLVEAPIGLRSGFEMGAHFVLHKPLSQERSRASFRTVRALMKRERRRQLRVAVQIPVACHGTQTYNAKTLDLCEGGMAIRFAGRIARENVLRFSLELPGLTEALDVYGELAWEGSSDQAGVRFKDMTEEQRSTLRSWLNRQLPEPEQDDPPVVCRVTELSRGGCYLKTMSPFPKGTRVALTLKGPELDLRASGIVRVTHPEFGMGVEFAQPTKIQQDQVRKIIESLRAQGDKSAKLHVEPYGLEPPLAEESSSTNGATDDKLLDLFHHKSEVPVDIFLEQMAQHR